MRILPTNYQSNIYKQSNSLNFKSAARSYFDTTTSTHINTLSLMFRDDINWRELSEIIHTTFKNQNKINILCLACSDGSEPYTLGISLLEIPKDTTTCKDFTIKAIDKDADSIQAAKSGRINLTLEDIKRINSISETHTNYFIEQDSPLAIKNNLFSTQCYHSFKVSEKLKNKIIFEQGDILEMLKKTADNDINVVLCRNVAPYLSKNYQTTLVKTLETVLKNGSLFVIGNFDTIKAEGSIVTQLLNSSKYLRKVKRLVYQKI